MDIKWHDSILLIVSMEKQYNRSIQSCSWRYVEFMALIKHTWTR